MLVCVCVCVFECECVLARVCANVNAFLCKFARVHVCVCVCSLKCAFAEYDCERVIVCSSVCLLCPRTHVHTHVVRVLVVAHMHVTPVHSYHKSIARVGVCVFVSATHRCAA